MKRERKGRSRTGGKEEIEEEKEASRHRARREMEYVDV